jgi:hypothetical protein
MNIGMGECIRSSNKIQAASPFLAVNYSTNCISIYVCLTFLRSIEGLSNPRDQLLPQAHYRRPPGSAVGVGITITLPMNIRVAYRSAKIGFVFARHGLVMEVCSSFFLLRLIEHLRAMYLVTTGATYRADDKLFGTPFSELCDKPEDVLPA